MGSQGVRATFQVSQEPTMKSQEIPGAGLSFEITQWIDVCNVVTAPNPQSFRHLHVLSLGVFCACKFLFFPP